MGVPARCAPSASAGVGLRPPSAPIAASDELLGALTGASRRRPLSASPALYEAARDTPVAGLTQDLTGDTRHPQRGATVHACALAPVLDALAWSAQAAGAGILVNDLPCCWPPSRWVWASWMPQARKEFESAFGNVDSPGPIAVERQLAGLSPAPSARAAHRAMAMFRTATGLLDRG